MNAVLATLGQVADDVWRTFDRNWPFLLISVVVASALPIYIGADRMADWLRKRMVYAVAGAVVLATLTPFCSCGTTAVVLGAMASSVPWAPIVAFMVSSPLTSPEELVLSTGLFGLPFALSFFIAAMVLGVAAGLITHAIEKTGWLKGQARMDGGASASCCDPADDAPRAGGAQTVSSGPSGSPGSGRAAILAMQNGGSAPSAVLDPPVAPVITEVGFAERYRLDQFAKELWKNSRRLALYFFGFAAIGYLLIRTIPTAFLTDYLGEGSILAVPFAALIGIPVYLNTDGSLPLIATLMEGGMGPGAALAFMVTGAGTSIGAISGMLLIARKRIVGLVIGFLFVGALGLGWLAPLWI